MSKTALVASTVFAVTLALAAPVTAHPPEGRPAVASDHANGDHANGDHAKGGMQGMGNMADMKGMSGHDDDAQAGEHEHAGAEFSFGHPSPDAAPDQVVTINALDSMSYNPSSVSVEAGSVVKFVVTNKGEIAHAWAIDTVEEQLEHESGMENVEMENMMGHMDNEPNGFVLKPGETKTLVWTFTKGGTIQYACHLPGHYGAGMKGALAITGGMAMGSGDGDHEKSKTHDDH